MKSLRSSLMRRVVTGALALLLVACGGSVELLSNLREAEANDVIAALGDAGIKAEKLPGKDGAINLAVPASDVARAISHMNDLGLPRERRASMGDVFKKDGLISSPLEERARYLWALSQELSETVSLIDGVIRARVHVVLPERSTGGDPALPSSAAVFVKHQSHVNLEEAVPQIKRLVASSIPGLALDKVSVVTVPGASVRAGPAGSGKSMARAADERGTGTPGWLYGLVGLVTLSCLAVAAWQMQRARRHASAGAPAAVATGQVPGV